MSGDLALGIDVGTSGVRAAAIDRAGEPVGLGAATMAEFGVNHRAPAIWEAALAAALARLFETVAPARMGALAVDGTSGTVLALDGSDAPVGDALMYNDAVEREAIPRAIAAVAPRESAAHGASSALARALSLQERPGVRRLLHQADWIAERLAEGPLPTDESNALKTGYDPVARRWPEWLGETGLNVSLLPSVKPAGAETGWSRAAFGLPPGVKIVAGVTDGCASFLATGARRPGDGVTALGTTLTIKLLSDRPVFAPEYGVYSHRIGDMWLAGGASNTGGGALAAFFTAEEIARLSEAIDPETSSGLDYYPLPRPGERFPLRDPALAPRVAPRPAEDERFLHGLLEGIARIEAQGYARLAEFGAPALGSLRTVGGGARNRAWGAMRARIVDAPAAAARSEEAAVGVAHLALARLPA